VGDGGGVRDWRARVCRFGLSSVCAGAGGVGGNRRMWNRRAHGGTGRTRAEGADPRKDARGEADS
jgi:hypothetical protein